MEKKVRKRSSHARISLSENGEEFTKAHLDLVRRVGEEFGATQAQLAKMFDVAPRTISSWQKQSPEFNDAVMTARAKCDAKVEKSLYQRAIGYEHEVEKVFCNKDGKVTIAKYVEKIPPDNLAMIFWLKNRQRDDWRDVHRTEVTGAEGAPLPVINITLNTPSGEAKIVPAIDTTKALPGPKE